MDEEQLNKPEEVKAPKITSVKVYHGLGKDKKPDPYKILYYGMPNGSYIDAINGFTLNEKPHVVDHLAERPIVNEERDLIAAIMNGVFDQEDYDLLEKNNMISDTSRQLWQKVNKLKELTGGSYNSLVKSLDGGEVVEDDACADHDHDSDGDFSSSGSLFSDDDLTRLMNASQSMEPSVVETMIKQAMAASANDVRQVVIDVLMEYGLISGQAPEVSEENEEEPELWDNEATPEGNL
jgi:hypothetical protein